MKHVGYGLVFVLLFMLSLGTSGAQDAAGLSLSSLTLDVGGTGTIDGQINCPSGCGGFTIGLQFDPTLLRVDSAVPGPYLGSQVFVAENTVDNSAGTVRLVLAALGTPPANEQNILFTLNVTALAAGTASVAITGLEAADLNGTAVTLATSNGTVTINEPIAGLEGLFSHTDWKLVFTSTRDGNPEIYTMNVDGSNVTRLTENTVEDRSPVWSPDGAKIVFMSGRDGNPEIYVMNANGSDPQRLTDSPTFDGFPSWSPDGKQIVFTTDRDGSNEIYVMNADGTDPVRLTNAPGDDSRAAWSPTGNEIMFVSDREGSSELYLMNIDGSNVRRISDLFGATGLFPAWSPNARDIAFNVGQDGLSGVIYTLNTSENRSERLGEQTEPVSHMDWSVDGAWLVFVSARDGNSEIYAMDAQGQEPYRLTENDADDTEPDWLPVTSQACAARTDRTDVTVRVGPGLNRGSYTFMPVNQDIPVLGQSTDSTGLIWLMLDKAFFPGSENVFSLWVASSEVLASPSCASVAQGEVPPLVSQPTPPPPGQWGGCGSCTTCEHPSECVLSPEGMCLWDPSTCGPQDQGGDPDPGCYRLSLSWSPTGYGSATAYSRQPCQSRFSFQPGATVYINANVSIGGGYVESWSGSCPGLVTPGFNVTSQTVTMTGNCDVHVNFSYLG